VGGDFGTNVVCIAPKSQFSCEALDHAHQGFDVDGCFSNDIVLFWFFLVLSFFIWNSASKAIEILEAYEGTLEDDYPPENERCEHGEMLLYKVFPLAVAAAILCLMHNAASHIFYLV